MELRYHPTVPFSMLRGLFGVIERAGVPRSQLMELAEIRADELEIPNARLSRPRFERACVLAVELTGDAALGLHWAALMNERSFGPIAEGLAAASTLRQALSLLERFERFFTNTASFALLEDSTQARVRTASGADRSLVAQRFLSELSIAWYANLIRTICPGAALDRVAFAYPAPCYHPSYARMFGKLVCFSQPFTEVGFDRAWLDVPRRASGEHDGGAGSALHDDGAPVSYAVRLRTILAERAPTRVSMGDAARALGIHERSLRRRLTAEGQSFKEVEFQALANVAMQKLSDERLSIEETAVAMGFSGASAFHRAFKRWTGQTPSNFQRFAPLVARR